VNGESMEFLMGYQGLFPYRTRAQCTPRISSCRRSDAKKSGSKRTWTVYLYRTLKQIHKDVGMSSKGMRVVNSFVQNIFERIATEAASLMATGPVWLALGEVCIYITSQGKTVIHQVLPVFFCA